MSKSNYFQSIKTHTIKQKRFIYSLEYYTWISSGRMYHKITVSNMTNNELWVSKKSIDHIIELLLLLPFKKCVWASQGLSKINTQKTTLQWWSCAGSVVMLDGAPQVIHTSSRLTLFYPIFSFFYVLLPICSRWPSYPCPMWLNWSIWTPPESRLGFQPSTFRFRP